MEKNVEYRRHVELGRQLNKEAHELVALVAAEFETDPLSTQCFDRRVVERVVQLVADRREWESRLQQIML